MKISSQRDKRNYIIIALCAVLVIMGVGYASFSSLLTINGTANISNSWCVGFDNTKTNTMNITKGVSTGTTPTGSMSYSGTACGSTLQPTSSLAAHFYQPGDEIEYTLTITNKSTVTAAIKSILVDNESVTSNTTKKKDNIIYVIEMPEDTTLTPNASTTMKVTIKFQNETSVTGPYSGETKTIEVKINAEEDDGNGGFTPTPATQTVYAINNNSVRLGDSLVNTISEWCIVDENEGYNSCEDDDIFNSEDNCLTTIDGWDGATCVQAKTIYSSCQETGKNVCLKYTLEDDKVTGADVCFIKDGTEYCLQGWKDECLPVYDDISDNYSCTYTGITPVYNSNKLVMQSAFTEENACADYGDGYRCDLNDWSAVSSNDGSVYAITGTDSSIWDCFISPEGAYCDNTGGTG